MEIKCHKNSCAQKCPKTPTIYDQNSLSPPSLCIPYKNKTRIRVILYNKYLFPPAMFTSNLNSV